MTSYGSLEAVELPRREGNRQRSLIAAATVLASCAAVALLASSATKVGTAITLRAYVWEEIRLKQHLFIAQHACGLQPKRLK